jgi:hypothetical protein
VLLSNNNLLNKTLNNMKLTDKVKNFIVASLSDKIFKEKADALKQAISSSIETEYLKTVPKAILEIFKDENLQKYVLCTTTCCYYSATGRLYNFSIRVPTTTSLYITNTSHPELFEGIQEVLAEYMELCKQRPEFENKLKCTLDSIGTDTRLKVEFPEAYELFKKETDGCTQIESLRAIISNSN